MKSRAGLLLLTISSAFLVLTGFWARGFTVDDAFISFRYAYNWGHGYGLVWNLGQPPVEGYTNFSLVLVLALLARLNLDIVLMAKVIGVVSGLLSLIALYSIGVRLDAPLGGGIAALIFAVLKYTPIHLISGMETFLFTAVAIWDLYWAITLLNNYTTRRMQVFCLVGLLLGLTRPEGVLLFGCMLIGIIMLGDRRTIRSELLWATVLFLLPGTLYMVWRFGYFGYLFPNTFYVKVSQSLNLDSIRELRNFAFHLVAPLVFIGLIAAIDVSSFRRTYTLVLFSTLGFLGYYSTASLWQNFADRFFFPAIPFIMVGTIPVLQKTATLLSSRQYLKQWPFAIILLGTLVFWSGQDLRMTIDQYLELGRGQDGNNHIGQIIAHHAHDFQYTVVAPDAGAIAFYSRQNVIDPIGLNDVYLAHLGRLDTDYVFRSNPEILVLPSYRPDKIEQKAFSTPLSQHPAFSHYKLVGKYGLTETRYFPATYFEFVYVLKDRTDLESLAVELQRESNVALRSD